jgi:hypothetical protein
MKTKRQLNEQQEASKRQLTDAEREEMFNIFNAAIVRALERERAPRIPGIIKTITNFVNHCFETRGKPDWYNFGVLYSAVHDLTRFRGGQTTYNLITDATKEYLIATNEELKGQMGKPGYFAIAQGMWVAFRRSIRLIEGISLYLSYSWFDSSSLHNKQCLFDHWVQMFDEFVLRLHLLPILATFLTDDNGSKETDKGALEFITHCRGLLRSPTSLEILAAKSVLRYIRTDQVEELPGPGRLKTTIINVAEMFSEEQ